MGKETAAVTRNRLQHNWRKPKGCLWVALIVLALLPLQAQAHARMLRSNPADHSTLTNSPTQIELWFNELLEEKFNTVEVFADEPSGAKPKANLAEGSPKLDRKDRTHLTISLKALAPGPYVVEWRVLSRDGHSAPGRISFRVQAPK
jgi:methionine-rich copper-binding protein CopC